MYIRVVKSPLLAASCLLLFGSVAYGQASEISAFPNSRPAINAGTDLVPARAVQFENGLSWSDDGHSKAIDGPESLMRIGLSNRVEFQITLPDMHGPGFNFEDLALGTKIRVGSAISAWPMAVVGSLSFPTGSPSLTSGGIDPSLSLAVSHSISHGLQLSSSLDVASLSDASAGRIIKSEIALDLGWCINPDTCLFVEGAPFLGGGNGNSGVTTDAGMALILGRHLPFDWRVGTIAQPSGTTVFVSLGYSFRRIRGNSPKQRYRGNAPRYPRLEADSSRSRTP